MFSSWSECEVSVQNRIIEIQIEQIRTDKNVCSTNIYKKVGQTFLSDNSF